MMRIDSYKNNYPIQPVKRKGPIQKFSEDNQKQDSKNNSNKEKPKKSKFDIYV